MNALIDEDDRPVAYVYNHAIFLPADKRVAGLILGHFVYDIHGMIKGKFFDHRLYNESGEIIAVSTFQKIEEEIDLMNILDEAWRLLERITPYEIGWVQPQLTWGSQTLSALLL